MSDIAIKVEGLGKRYKIGRLQRRHDTLRDRIADARIFNLFKRNGNGHNGNGSALTSDPRPLTSDTDLWALRDVSFEVKRGEVVGVIGRNGAGKSTLLKILSRITDPTTGYADINGLVASLLEVGTGFHPELTGRENIYLNGSILGMKRAEIKDKFDEILAFAEIEKFIDTPVKYYSSGMYVRLAFAVAAHLEPEILLVDEVLAVGDAAFQKKCLGKMGDVARAGRTVLFVSHNMQAVQMLCPDSVLLEHGRLTCRGSSIEVLSRYQQALNGTTSESGHVLFSAIGDPKRSVNLTYARTCDPNGNTTTSIPCGGTMVLEVGVQAQRATPLFFDFQVKDEFGSKLALVSSYFSHDEVIKLDGEATVRAEIQNINLAPGKYFFDLSVHLHGGEKILSHDKAIDFEVTSSDFLGTGKLPSRALGLFVLPSKWLLER